MVEKGHENYESFTEKKSLLLACFDGSVGGLKTAKVEF